MNSFPQRHAAAVMGQRAGWDRLRFRGTLRMLANVVGMFRFLCYRGQLLKDFGDYAHDLSQQVRAASLAVAEQAGRPVVHLNGPSIPKEDQARQIARRDGVEQGLIGVLTAVEPCWSYNIRSDGKGKAAGRGEFVINGLRNRDLQELLFANPAVDAREQRPRSGQVTRKLRILRAHGLLRKVPRTHRHMVSDKRRQLIAALHAAREADTKKLTAAA